MRRKKEMQVDAEELILAIGEIALKNNISKEEAMESIENVVREKVSEILNVDEDSLKVSFNDEGIGFELERQVVATLEEEQKDKILYLAVESIKDKKEQKKVQVGDILCSPIEIEDLLSRNQIAFINRTIFNSFKDIKKIIFYKKYLEKVGTLITGTLIRKQNRDLFISFEEDQIEGKLSYQEQSPIEKFNFGDKVRVLIKEVSLNDRGRLEISLSRSDEEFFRNLLKVEIPEYAEGNVDIEKIVRHAGRKTKMSVYSKKKGIEPVGAFVGLSGSRIKEVIKELQGERIDIIPFNEDIKQYAVKAIQPGEAVNVLIIDKEEKKILVIVTDDSYALAIGKDGINIKLASQLIDWDVSVRTKTQIQSNPDSMEIFIKAENYNLLHKDISSDIEQLEGLEERIIVRLMNAGIYKIEDIIDKSDVEISRIEGLTKEDAFNIKKMIEENVEIVEDEQEIENKYYKEFEDEVESNEEDSKVVEEIQDVEYVECPECGFEFEYEGQNSCPSCKVEFEVEE